MKRKRDELSRPAREWRKIRVGLFVPVGETIYSQCFASLMRFSGYHGLPMIDMGRSPMLEMTRSRACLALLETDLTHILMLDADHLHPPEILPMLASHGLDVVAGLNFNRGGDNMPCCYVDGDEPWDGKTKPELRIPVKFPSMLHRVAIAGTGSMLISRRAIERLDWPFFECPAGDDWRPRKVGHAWPGEDVGFAANCRRNGICQYVDTRATSPHLGHVFVEGMNQ